MCSAAWATPETHSGYKTQSTSSDSCGSPADVSSDKTLIYHTLGVLPLCTTITTRLGTAIFLLFSFCGTLALLYNLSFYTDVI